MSIGFVGYPLVLRRGAGVFGIRNRRRIRVMSDRIPPEPKHPNTGRPPACEQWAAKGMPSTEVHRDEMVEHVGYGGFVGFILALKDENFSSNFRHHLRIA